MIPGRLQTVMLNRRSLPRHGSTKLNEFPCRRHENASDLIVSADSDDDERNGTYTTIGCHERELRDGQTSVATTQTDCSSSIGGQAVPCSKGTDAHAVPADLRSGHRTVRTFRLRHRDLAHRKATVMRLDRGVVQIDSHVPHGLVSLCLAKRDQSGTRK
jgi:hypothetical protein